MMGRSSTKERYVVDGRDYKSSLSFSSLKFRVGLHIRSVLPFTSKIHIFQSHLRNIRQLTFGGSNAEGYFSYNNKKLTYQATLTGSTNCDQIYQMDLTEDPRTQVPKRMSTGENERGKGEE